MQPQTIVVLKDSKGAAAGDQGLGGRQVLLALCIVKMM
jgi:hypothetical protein